MNEDELASLLNALEQGLIQLGLSSLVNQERISAVEGKVEEVTSDDVAELRREWSQHSSGRAPGARDGDVRIRPLDAGERLAMLLDLVEVGVGGTYAIEIHLRDDIKTALDEGENWSGQVVFADSPESQPVAVVRPEWELPDQATIHQREAAVRDVILLVNQLRGQADLPRGERLHSVDAPGAASDADSDLTIPGDWS
jgi:hypothetical protein